MYAVRLWSVRHAGFWERVLPRASSGRCVAARPAAAAASATQRLERRPPRVERSVKGLLFDCQMCGQCVLSSTGMSCPMNCPKQLRNGPCGGVRPNGHCEVSRRCAASGCRPGRAAGAWPAGERDRARCSRRSTAACEGSSSWLRVVRENGADDAPRDDPQRRAGAGLTRCRPCPGHCLAAAGSSACCAPARSPSPPSSTRPIPPTRDEVYDRALVLFEGCATPSTPPTAAAPTATCRASASARC